MIPPERALVVPRVVSPETVDALPLDESFVSSEGRSPGAVEIVGGPGSGKTTALKHLAAVVAPDQNVLLLDEPDSPRVTAEAAARLVVYTTASPRTSATERIFLLAPWRDDELIEYLLAVHPQQCRSVMERLRRAEDRRQIGGLPVLWRIVLDQMAVDESITEVREALRRDWQSRCPTDEIREFFDKYALASLAGSDFPVTASLARWKEQGYDVQVLHLTRHRVMQVLLAAEYLAGALRSGGECPFLARRLPRDVVSDTAAAVATDAGALDSLRNLLVGKRTEYDAMAASILHSAGVDWVPSGSPSPHLSWAYLECASWPEVDLARAVLCGTDLTAANLTGSTLEGADAQRVCLRHAVLRGASLINIRADLADLSHADLCNARATRARFQEATLREANLRSAVLSEASFQDADLSGAQFCRADLSRATLFGAVIEGTDFSEANLCQAGLSGLRLRDALLSDACLNGAQLVESDLEHVVLPDAKLEKARLDRAALTGSAMPRANLRKARLRGAGLADINWEQADLRGADLRESTFHMGSSRSGLVDSPIASEGSRTGFYSDDYDQQHFKSPEEIRKANLCKADLRGARIDGVDFYLVDLRGARYDAQQAEHFRRCGAILVDRG